MDLSLKDIRGRTCLHYAFIKFGRKASGASGDPIEIVSNLLGLEGLDLNAQDIWGKTALHYACASGASTSALYLMSFGADVNIKDVFDNSPLGVAVANRKWDIAINIMQKNIDCNQPVTVQEDMAR